MFTRLIWFVVQKLLSKAIDTLREYFVEMLLDDDILSSKPDESDIPSHQSEGSPARYALLVH